MALDGGIDEAAMSQQESAAEFGDEFLERIRCISKASTELPVQSAPMSRPVHGLMIMK